MKIPEDDYCDLEPVIACVEIKTWVAYNTINDAEVARLEHGEVIACAYNDAILKKCDRAKNRVQMIHQAWVTGLKWGVMVTAKVEEEEEYIV